MARAREYDCEFFIIAKTDSIRLSFGFHFDLVRGIFNIWQNLDGRLVLDFSENEELPCSIIETFDQLLDLIKVHTDECMNILELAKKTEAEKET